MRRNEWSEIFGILALSTTARSGLSRHEPVRIISIGGAIKEETPDLDL